MADDKAKKKQDDPHEQRKAELQEVLDQEKADMEARHERALAQVSVPQKVIDGNETAALASITGQKPVRDMSDAPPPNRLGPHESGTDGT